MIQSKLGIKTQQLISTWSAPALVHIDAPRVGDRVVRLEPAVTDAPS